MKMLTHETIRKQKPAADRIEIRDSGCRPLLLIVHPSGKKVFAMRFRRPDGRMAKLTLGEFSDVAIDAEPVIGTPLTLAAARRLAMATEHDRKTDKDPIAAHADAKAVRKTKQAERDSNLFGALAVKFIRDYAMPRNRTWKASASLLGLDSDLQAIPGGLAERWALRPVQDITSRMILDLIDEARTDTVPGRKRSARRGETDGMGRAFFAILSKFFAWLRSRLVIEVNPCAGLTKPPTPAARDRVLSDDEIRSFWKACDEMGGPYGAVFKVLLLTGGRLDEVAHMTRDEISSDGMMWNLGADRVKNKKAHFVPLSPMVRDLIAAQPRFARCPFVFSSLGKGPVISFSTQKARLDDLMALFHAGTMPDWRLHDLRRTCASGLAGLGIPPIVIEKCLNHVSGAAGGMVGIYQRHDYSGERRKAFEAWEHRVNEIVTGRAINNVVKIGSVLKN
jgi:integrase